MADVQSLLDGLRSIDVNPLIDAQSFEQAQNALKDGLPTRRTEAWKYTNVDRWYDDVDLTPPPKAIDIENNGLSVQVRSREDGVAERDPFDPGDFPLAAINHLLLTNAAEINAASGNSGSARIRSGGAHQHIVVTAAPQSEIIIIEEPAAFLFRHIEIHVGQGAQVTHYKRALDDDSASCALVTVNVESDGIYRSHSSLQGGRLRRIDIDVALSGPGAHAEVGAAWRIDGRRHLDQHVGITHFATDTTSNQFYRGVAGGRSTGILNGRIHIAKHAQRSHAELSTKNLLESTNATINAKPELEIYADDVRCSHGATIGEMDRDALFYFRSRGIDLTSARALLLSSFLGEALNIPTDENPSEWMP